MKEISYGKRRVVFYRLAKRSAPPFAAAVTIDVFGERFLAAYTEGDNTEVVATDTMKNFVYATAAEFTGRSLESYVGFLGGRLLDTYPQMDRIKVAAQEIPLDGAHAPAGDWKSDVVFRSTRSDTAMAEASFERTGGGVRVTDARSGIEGMRLLKTTGSSFASFARDSYTTLPDLTDRPLTILLDAHWRYGDPRHAAGEDSYDAPKRGFGKGHVPADYVRRAIEFAFHEFNSRSIQHLVHEMGTRILREIPAISEIEFEAENHTPDAVTDGPGDVKVFAEPRQTFGKIGLRLRR